MTVSQALNNLAQPCHVTASGKNWNGRILEVDADTEQISVLHFNDQKSYKNCCMQVHLGYATDNLATEEDWNKAAQLGKELVD